MSNKKKMFFTLHDNNNKLYIKKTDRCPINEAVQRFGQRHRRRRIAGDLKTIDKVQINDKLDDRLHIVNVFGVETIADIEVLPKIYINR